jgi:hypothetical protein
MARLKKADIKPSLLSQTVFVNVQLLPTEVVLFQSKNNTYLKKSIDIRTVKLLPHFEVAPR